MTVDETEVTENVSDWLTGLGWIGLIIGVLLIALIFAVSIAIAKKAGYNGWWGAIFVLAWPIGWLFVALFAVLKWPVVKERDEAYKVLRENGLTTARMEKSAVKATKKAEAEQAKIAPTNAATSSPPPAAPPAPPAAPSTSTPPPAAPPAPPNGAEPTA